MAFTAAVNAIRRLGFGTKNDETREEGDANDEWLQELWRRGGWLWVGVDEKEVVAQKADATEGGPEKVQEWLDRCSRRREHRSC